MVRASDPGGFKKRSVANHEVAFEADLNSTITCCNTADHRYAYRNVTEPKQGQEESSVVQHHSNWRESRDNAPRSMLEMYSWIYSYNKGG
uniref:Ovule protein n=1 Tax=Steinernema glaseri TaxID=37863 RepID=A0A1I7Y4W0_9BILA